MVKVVRSVARGVVIAAAALELAQATPLECNAYMPTGVGAPLTDDHPAVMKEYNGAVPVEVSVDQCKAATPTESETIVGSLTSESSSGSSYARNLRRMEDASNSDIDDLQIYFGDSLELDFTTLKEKYSSGAAPTTPWPGSYWPTYQDSINVIWKTGEGSASEKYAKAYGLDPADFMNKVSANNGVDSRSASTTCTDDSVCKPLNDGSVCAKRKDATNGYCIPTWYGICHAWSPAALLEAEPKCDVVKNGQTFHVLDIKALITDVYDGSGITTVFTGARFNGPDNPVSTDSYGRYTSAARRDLGAGFFHIAISNILGKHNQSFILDVTAGSQVWNQPVRSYNVLAMKLVDAAQASQQYFNTSTYPFNSEMVYLAYVKTTLSWIVEAYADGPLVSTGKLDPYTVSDEYQYLLELDANYAVIGGEWVEGSKTDHPDFLWFPTAKPDASTVTSTGLSYATVKELLELSVSCGASEAASVSASESASTGASTSTSASVGASTSASGASASTSEAASTSGSTSNTSVTSASGTSEAASTGGSTSTRRTSASGASEGASTSGPTSTSTSGTSASGNSEATSTSGSTSTNASRTSTSGTSEAASTNGSTPTTASGTSASGASASTSEAALTSGSSSSGSNENGSTGSKTPSTAYSGTGTNENASAGVAASSSTSGEGSYVARGASEDGFAAVTPGGNDTGGTTSGSVGTTDATGTYSSRSSTGSTEEDTTAGEEALTLSPSTTTPSTMPTDEPTAAPIDTGYYTAPPTTNGQDLADVLDTIDTTHSSSSSAQETDADTPSSSEQETVSTTTQHYSCR